MKTKLQALPAKILSSLMVIAMLMSLLAISAVATEETPEDTGLAIEITDGSSKDESNGSKDLEIPEGIQPLAGGQLFAALEASYLTIAPGTDATQLTFSWHTAAKTTAPAVRIWTGGATAETASVFTGTSSSSASTVSTMYYNRATATGLAPNTAYTYQVGDGEGNWSAEYTTKTGNPDAFRFLVVGDPQIGTSNVTNDTNAWVRIMNSMEESFPDAAFLAGTGDQVETSGTRSHYTGFFTPTQMTSLPFASVMGNHEGSNVRAREFYNPSPSNTDSVQNYWYRYGDTLFLVWNCTTGSPSGMRTFLQNAIAANPDAKWTILSFHFDVYGQGTSHALSDGKNYRDQYVAVIDEFDIDVVFNGHDHSYNRSYPMKWSGSSGTSNNAGRQDETFGPNGESIDPEGTVYFSLNSATGSKYYSLTTKQYYTAVMQQANRPHFSVVDMTATSFTCTTYQLETNNSLTQIDTYTIVKEAEAPQTDKTELSGTITVAAAKVENEYTADSWAVFAAALANAQTVKSNATATQAEIDAAAAALNAAIAGLVAQPKTTVEETYAVSDFGDTYLYYGRKATDFFTDAFDMSKTTGWTSAKTTIGFGSGPSGHSLATTIPTGSGSNQRGALHTWTYMKKTFELPEDFDVNDIVDASGIHVIDDALVIYVNGIEVYAYNSTPNGNNVAIGAVTDWNVYPGYNTEDMERSFNINSNYSNRDAGPTGQGDSYILRDAASLTNLKAALKPGTNIITCVVGQRDSGSSDLFFDLKLSITTSVAVATPADKTALEAAIAEAEALVVADYTADSWAVLAEILSQAKELYADDQYTQEYVDFAVFALRQAIAALVLDEPVDDGKIRVSISTNASVRQSETVEYTVSLKGDVKDVRGITLTFTVDADMLAGDSKETEALNDFMAVGSIQWTKLEGEGNMYSGTITLALQYGLAETDGTVDVAAFRFKALKLGEATMTLTDVVIAGFEESKAVYFASRIETESATTEVIKNYSPYDLNRDGKIDLLDLIIANEYRHHTIDSDSVRVLDSHGVAVYAYMCDFDGNGTVEMFDIMELFLNYTSAK